MCIGSYDTMDEERSRQCQMLRYTDVRGYESVNT